MRPYGRPAFWACCASSLPSFSSSTAPRSCSAFRRPSRPQPELFELTWFAGILETFGGFLLLIGLFTRPVAFVLSGLMAFAYWIAHAPQNTYPVLNGGDGAILFCFLFLYLAAAGPGAFSVDGAREAGH